MSAGPVDPSPDPLIGQKVGGFVLQRVIGEGGMGRVYLAEHPALETRVAVKVLAEEYRSQPHMVDRFFDEARSVNRIQQENIVNILDLSQLNDGRFYILMEYLEGETLLDRLKRDRKLRVHEAAAIGLQALAGLAATHRVQIVHRDLKPANIFLVHVPQGLPFVKLLDFGIAKLTSRKDSTTTITGTIVGTPTYMAPEQAAGKPNEIDQRSDLFSLGVVLYQLLTGARPFKGDSVAELYLEQMTKLPIPARRLDPMLPEAIEDFLIRALQREKAMRFQSASEMAAALASASGLHLGPVARPKAPPSSLNLSITPAHIEALVAAKQAAERATLERPPPGAPDSDIRAPGSVNSPVSSPSLLHGTGEMAQQTRPPRTVSKWPLVAAGILSAGLTFGALAVLISDDPGPVEEPVPTATRDVDADEDEAAEADEKSTDDEAEGTDDPATVLVDIESNPAGATVVLEMDGEPLGDPVTTPASVEVPAGGEVRLVATADGRMDIEDVRTFAKSEKILIELPPLPKAKKAKKTPRKKKTKGVSDEDAPMEF